MYRPRAVHIVLTEDAAACRPASAAGEVARRLHRSRRGNISVLFLMLSMLLFISLCLVWNTGQTISAKMHTQTVADASAYSAAVWMSRGVNNITGTNMLILRNASANVVCYAVMMTTIMVPVNWAVYIARQCSNCGIFCPACAAAAAAYVAAVEMPPYIRFVNRAAGTAFGTAFSTWRSRINELFRYEQAWVDAIPSAIENQRQELESYYGSRIRFSRPGDRDGRIRLPVERGSFLTLLGPLVARFYMNDNKWPREGNFNQIREGRANAMWNLGAAIGFIVVAATNGNRHYVLTTQWGPLEFGPSSLDDWKDFTVIATAMEENASFGRLMAPGVFNHSIVRRDAVVAYAQAETYNGIDGRLAQIGFQVPYPFRVWTTYGWHWQPRLTRGDQFRNALRRDAVMRNWYGRIMVRSTDNFDAIALH